MRKITANYIFPVSGPLLKNGIIVLNDQNQIVELIDRKGDTKEIQDLEYYSGIIVPGFIDSFVLLSRSGWQFTAGLSSMTKLLEDVKSSGINKNDLQRGINQLEAFGSKGAVDYFPLTEEQYRKEKSKIDFVDLESAGKCELQLPAEISDSTKPVLLNTFTAASIEENLNELYCIGSGSIALSGRLSVWEQMKLLQKQFPAISIWDLIKWATLNPAQHFGFEKLGSLVKGKNPGLNLLTKIDFENWKLKDDSELKVLI
jgi:N-acetylglucosamine-6-phosphate deacetylase